MGHESADARVRRLQGFDEAEAIEGGRRAGSNGAIVWRSVEAAEPTYGRLWLSPRLARGHASGRRLEYRPN